LLLLTGLQAGARDNVNATPKEVDQFREVKPARAPASAPPSTSNTSAPAVDTTAGRYPFSGPYDPESAEQTYGTFCISCAQNSHHNDLLEDSREILRFLQRSH
jgi:hypothetical protein